VVVPGLYQDSDLGVVAPRARDFTNQRYRWGSRIDERIKATNRNWLDSGSFHAKRSSGGRAILLGICKRSDKYLRTLLIHGARAVVRVADRHDNPLSQWIRRVKERRGVHKATVAVANKTARQLWAQLAYG
jgi:hypothetical protein